MSRVLDDCKHQCPDVFSACVVTRAMAARGLDSDVPLNDTFLAQPTVVEDPSLQSPVGEPKTVNAVFDSNCGSIPTSEESDKFDACSWTELFMISREELIHKQTMNSTLEPLVSNALSKEKSDEMSHYFMQDGLLCRQFVHRQGTFSNTVMQVVVPHRFRKAVLDLAHTGLAGHTGVRKTCDRIVRRFFWPRLKRDVASYVKSCHVCQMTAKPNQRMPVAPLQPIPVMSNPSEHLIVDCVGPLPRSKAGHSFLLTVMCQATRYPAAYPLRSITTKSVLKALVNFTSTFGIPKVIQSDQGSNFMSKQFSRALRQLKARHNISSAHHPQSQGALERFHQTLKSLLRSYWVELGSDWEEGLPCLLLASREVVQESMGFSPKQLVFGHSVRGLPAVLADEWCNAATSFWAFSPTNVLDYVSGFRYRLYEARAAATRKLGKAQSKMRCLFNRKAKHRSFEPGEKVLALLPLLHSHFQAKFCGPYEVVKCLPDYNYLLSTPDRRKKVQVCHINLLKSYAVPDPSTPVGLIASLPAEGAFGSSAVTVDGESGCLGSDEIDEVGCVHHRQS
ncbi:hypothetical protein ACEWY4_025661 [Coilia grayii]|uniref:Gypsy retrotransposon integrase-like protein 1 n=1 Tax=Coilia grayii TaxID=363190 RepID=A0ABD1IVL0_9TELE